MGRKRKFDTTADRQAVYRVNKNERDAQAHKLAALARLVIGKARERGLASANTPDAEVLERVAAMLAGDAQPAPVREAFPTF